MGWIKLQVCPPKSEKLRPSSIRWPYFLFGHHGLVTLKRYGASWRVKRVVPLTTSTTESTPWPIVRGMSAVTS